MVSTRLFFELFIILNVIITCMLMVKLSMCDQKICLNPILSFALMDVNPISVVIYL
jgi:hypothetical protein